MKVAHFSLLVLIAVLVILVVSLVIRKEEFSEIFNQAEASNEFVQYLDMGDHRTMVQLQRGDSGKTVLLLHNSPMNLNLWQPLFQTMQRKSMLGRKTPNLVAYDLRGHGTAWMPVDPSYNDTDLSNTFWNLDMYAMDCKKVYDKIIQQGKIIVCGFGFGGQVAQKFALNFPDLVEKLVLLQSTTRPTPGLDSEIEYLGGPNGWIARNPRITYLTSQESWIQQILCGWFFLPNVEACPKIQNGPENIDDEISPQYKITQRMYRKGSATTTLQVDKIMAGTNLENDWANAPNMDFMIFILAATDDPLSPPDLMTNTYTSIFNQNRSLNVVFDVVNGRHAFTIMYPDYIAGIICDECTRINVTATYSTEFNPGRGF